MSTFVIRVDGTDVTNDVILADAEFTTQASGSPGLCRFRVKDVDMSYMFTVGKELTLDIDGRRMWGGFIMSVSRQFFFPVEVPVKPRDPCDPLEFSERALLIEGADYNILFRKRFIFDKDDPTNADLRKWAAGENDDTIIRYMCENYLDLSGDGIDYTTLVDRVGTPNDDEASTVFGPGYSWEEAMQAIAWMPGAIYYINPDKQLVYADVDVPNASHELHDVPGDGQVGYREMEILKNGSKLVNDALVWGVGQGSDQVQFSRTQDTASITEHNRWQFGDYRQDMWRQSTVDKRANRIVYGTPQSKRGGKDDAISVECTVKVPYFRVAEKAVFSSDVFGFTDVIPIRRQRITFVSPTDAMYGLTLSHFIDEPWNTVEFYFPRWNYRRPDLTIVIPEVRDPKFPFCPHPGSADGMLVFSDRFDRPQAQPPTSSGGQYWTSVGFKIPYPVSGGETLSGESRILVLDQYISSPVTVLLALNGAGVSTSFSVAVGQLSFSVAGTTGVVTLQTTVVGQHPTSNSTGWSGGSEQNTGTVPLDVLRGRFFVRLAQWSGAIFSGVKFWPQDQPEPFNWNVYMTGEPPNFFLVNEQYAPRWERAVYLNTLPRFEAIDVYGGPGGHALGDPFWSSSAAGEGGTGHSWDFWMKDAAIEPWNQYVPGGSGANSSITEYSTGNNPATPKYRMVVHRNQFFPAPETGYISTIEQTAPARLFPPVPATLQTGLSWPTVSNTVNSYTIRGEFHVTVGNPNPNFHFPVSIEIVHFDIGEATPYGYPYTMLGYVVATLQDPAPDYGDGSKVWIPFEATIPNPTRDGYIHWGVRLQGPTNLLGMMNNDPQYYGPFLLPNTKEVTVQLRKLSSWVGMSVTPRGQAFCLPPYGGGTTLNRICDTFAVYEGLGGGPKFFSLTKTYRPGTLEISLDGLTLRAGFDFTEYSPSTGQFLLFTDVSDATTIVACYMPE